MKLLARTGAIGELMATPSIQRKRVCELAKRKSFLSSFLVMFRL